MRLRNPMFLALLLALCLPGFAQTVPNPPINTTQIAMPLFTLAPSPATGATIAVIGNPGPQTIYYWIAARYQVGNAALAGPYTISTAPSPLSSTNYVTINPTLPAGATGYDVLKTLTALQPSGACACAVATGVSVGAVANDQSNTTSGYTVSTFNVGVLNLTLQNEVQSAGVSHLILRQNGVFVADLSAGGSGSVSIAATSPIVVTPNPITNSGVVSLLVCGSGQVLQSNGTAWGCTTLTGGGTVGGTGTAGYFPDWATGGANIQNSAMQTVTGPPAGINYALGGGLSWQINASHLTWNSGVAGSANIIIANTYAAGASNNAGGIVIDAAPATGSACAGGVVLNGGGTNANTNFSSVSVAGGCSNGFGATGSDLTLSAGSTSAGNSGGNVVLEPGTGESGNGSVKITGLADGCLDITSGLIGSTGSACGTGAGGVTNVATGAGLTGGPITSTGTISVPVGGITDTLAALANKPSAGLVATANLTLSGAQTIDGVAGTAGTTIVLATAQTSGAQNGPWIMQTGAWTRPPWYPSGGSLQAFQFIVERVRLGTVYGGSEWKMTTSGTITIDTTATAWTVDPIALNASTVTGVLPAANGGMVYCGAGICKSTGTAWGTSYGASGTGADATNVLTTNITTATAAGHMFATDGFGNAIDPNTGSFPAELSSTTFGVGSANTSYGYISLGYQSGSSGPGFAQIGDNEGNDLLFDNTGYSANFILSNSNRTAAIVNQYTSTPGVGSGLWILGSPINIGVGITGTCAPTCPTPTEGFTISTTAGVSGGELALAELLTPTSTSANAGLNIGQGSAPTSPVNGDLWITSTNLFYQAGGVTLSPLANPMTLAYDMIRGGASGVATVLHAPTTPNGIPQILASTPSGGVAGIEAWAVPGVPTDLQTGTSYSIPITDDVHLITGNNAAATAWTGFALANNYTFAFLNIGAGTITYTPASGLIYPAGTSTTAIPQAWFGFHYTDNTNSYMPVLPTAEAFADTSAGGLAETFNATTGKFGTIAVSCLTGSVPQYAVAIGSWEVAWPTPATP